MKINKSIFRTYDVRGKYPSEIDEESAFKIGRAFGQFLEGDNIAIGMDARESSMSLKKAVVKGLLSAGKKVTDIGLCNTPMLYFSVIKWNFDAGIEITASHNSSEFNGIKMVRNKNGNILQIGEEFGMKKIKELVSEAQPEEIELNTKKKSILQEYLKELDSKLKKRDGLKIVIDYGNGVGSLSAEPFFKNTNFEIFSMFSDPKPDFPNHEPNPHDKENFVFLSREVVKRKADLGIFFDGDADRAIPVNEKGVVLRGDVLIGILALDILKDCDEKQIYYDLRCTKSLKEEIENLGGIPVKMRVGNPYYKEKLINLGGALGGETSGHIMYKEHYCIDDGLYAMIKLINIMKESRKPLSELEEPFSKYSKTYEINIEAKNKEAKLREIEKNYLEQGGKIEKIDGVTVEFENWWFNIRTSNTENLFRLNLEADTEGLMLEKKEEVKKLVLK